MPEQQFPVYAGGNAVTKVSAQATSFDEAQEQEQVVEDIMLCCKKVSDETSDPVSEEKKDTYSAFATTGEKNALEKAKSYISYSAFSYDGLVDQLEYSGFTHEQAVYGAKENGY